MIELELYHKTVAAIALAEGKPEKKGKNVASNEYYKFYSSHN